MDPTNMYRGWTSGKPFSRHVDASDQAHSVVGPGVASHQATDIPPNRVYIRSFVWMMMKGRRPPVQGRERRLAGPFPQPPAASQGKIACLLAIHASAMHGRRDPEFFHWRLKLRLVSMAEEQNWEQRQEYANADRWGFWAMPTSHCGPAAATRPHVEAELRDNYGAPSSSCGTCCHLHKQKNHAPEVVADFLRLVA